MQKNKELLNRLNQLEEDEQRFRDIVFSMADWVWEVDRNGFYVYCSDQVEKLLGYTRDEIIGKQPFDLMVAGHAEEMREKFTRMAKAREPIVDFEKWNVSKDGRKVCLLTNGVPIIDSAGKYQGYRGVDRDITDKKLSRDKINQISKGISAETGEGFFRSLTKQLIHILDADYAFIGEMSESSPDKVKTIAVNVAGEAVDNFEYDLKGTPCADVANDKICAYPSSVQNLFPEDHLLVEMGVNAYVGAPLHNADGTVTGLLVVLYKNPIPDAELAKSLINIFAIRTAAEIERRQATESMLLTQARMQNALHGARLGYWDWDIPKGETYYSSEWYTMLGYEPDEFPPTYDTWAALVHPDDLEIAIETLQGELEKRSPEWVFMSRMKHKNGDYRWIEHRGRVIESDEEGRHKRASGTNHDITEWVKDKRALEKSEYRLRQLMGSLPVGIQECDKEGNITYASESYERIECIPQGTGTNYKIWDFMNDPDEVEELKRYLKYLVEQEPPAAPYFGKNITLDGREIEIQVDWDYIRDKEGKVTGFASVISDITARKKMEKTLAEDRQMLEDILEGTNAGTWDWNVQTGEVEFNDRWAAIMGRTLSELEPIDISTWVGNVHPEDLPETEKALHKHFSKEQDYYDVEFRQPHKNGGWVWVNARGKVVSWTDDGTPLRMRGTHLDITKRKKAEAEKLDIERQMQHAQKLESLGVLAGGIAHDFNNILMGVLGNAELALLKLPNENPVKDNIQAIMDSSARAADLAKQMLAYSGRGQFLIGPVNVNLMVTEMTHLLKTTISKTAVLKYNLAEQLPPIQADVTQVRQVFMNLITNASEAIGETAGVITAGTGVMEVEEGYIENTFVNDDVGAGFYVFIEVSDTGCGMDKEVQAKIFDPFFTTKFTGRGLGMAATLGIIRGHKGAIRVYSEPGKGTSIKVLFPVSEDCRKAGEDFVCKDTSVRKNVVTGDGKILVVDDEEAILSIAEETLSQQGYEVLTAPDGREGVETLRKHDGNISLVLLDMTMPHMDGAATYSEMKKIAPDLKVILSSGYSEKEATERFAGKGLSGFIQKPYRPSELLETVAQIQTGKGVKEE